MKRIRTALLPFFALLPSLLAAGCGGSGLDVPDGDLSDLPVGLVVTWFSTSLIVGGADLTDAGTRLEWTFRSDGTYTIVVTGDLNGDFCEGVEPDCIEVGTFNATTEGTAQVVLNPNDDPVVLSATVTLTDLRLVGTSDGRTLDLSFVAPPVPELIGTWVAIELVDPDGAPLAESGSPTTLVFTFEADGSYSFASTFASVPEGFCDPAIHCVEDGTYSATEGTLVVDPGGPDATTLDMFVIEDDLQLTSGETGRWSFYRLDVATPETGSWFAISLIHNGVELTDGGTFQRLTLSDGLLYFVDTTDSPVRFLCGVINTGPECSAQGSYISVTNDSFEFTEGVDAAPTPLVMSMEVTPRTLRLFGAIDGVAVDLFYVRVPDGV